MPVGLLLKLLLHSPVLLVFILFYLFSTNKDKIREDLLNFKAWPSLVDEKRMLTSLCSVLVMNKAFRNVFYMRIGRKSWVIGWLLPPLKDVELSDCDNVAGGFNLIHGHNVVINSNVKIGKNCIVLHGVTIGEDWKGGVPTIGDDVFIGCHAIIIGNIHIGNRAKIGAGAIVVEDIPDGATVVGNKCRIILRKNGHKEKF